MFLKGLLEDFTVMGKLYVCQKCEKSAEKKTNIMQIDIQNKEQINFCFITSVQNFFFPKEVCS